MANKENSFILNELTDLKDELAKVIPGYSAAQKKFAEMSEPVNQSQVLNAMLGVLRKPGEGERVAPFLNVLGTGEQALLKRSTGYPRYEAGDLSKVLNQNQMDAVNKVSSELTRDLSISKGAARGGEALRGIIERNSPNLRLINLLDARVALINRALGESEIKITEEMKKALIEGAKTGKSALELVNTLPTSERSKVIKAIIDTQGKVSGAATRAAIIGGTMQSSGGK